LIVVTAPGKAVLSGEYAVLRGAPAAALAVDRRVRVSVEPAGGPQDRLLTAGYQPGEWRFRQTGAGDVEWLGESADFALFETVWKACFRAGRPPLSVTIDTSAFFERHRGGKLGFGSSAALTVALAAALRHFDAGNGAPGDRAFDAHRRFQGGRGSGIDIATSLQGGLVDYRPGDCRPLDWPAGLHYRFLWSGRPANTADRIARLDAGDGRRTEEAMVPLCAAATEAMAAWRGGNRADVLAGMRRYVATLRDFSAALGLGVFDAGHEEMADLAVAEGVVYKPCGAGGGDIGVVLAADPREIEAFCRQAAQRGFAALDVAMDRHGVALQSEPRP